MALKDIYGVWAHYFAAPVARAWEAFLDALDGSLTGYVKKSGDTMTGDLKFNTGANIDTITGVNLVLARDGVNRLTFASGWTNIHSMLRFDYISAGMIQGYDSGAVLRGLVSASSTVDLADGGLNTQIFADYYVRFALSNTATDTAYYGYYSGTGSPTTTQLPNNANFCIWENTSDNTIHWYYNDGGTIKEIGPTVPVYDGAKARKTGSQTITHATWTTVDFNAEDWDTGSYHDNSTNNSRLTVATAGKYRFLCNLVLDKLSTSGGYTVWQLVFRLNGSGDLSSSRAQTHVHHDLTPDGYLGLGVALELTLSANDYMEVRVRQINDSSTSNYVIGAGSDDGSWFSVEKM